MKEYLIMILATIVLIVALFVGSEYDIYKKGWTEYFIAGIVLYIILVGAIVVVITKRRRYGEDTLPDTKYTTRYEKL